MGERGVFAVDRGIWDDPNFADEPFSEREAFLWLISEAAWRPTKARVGKVVIELARGQCAHSTRFMAGKWKWSEARVRRFLDRRVNGRSIDADTDAGVTRITICNYDKFQRVGLPTDAHSDAAATQQRRSSDAEKKQGNIETDTPPSPPSEARAPKGADRGRGSRIDPDWALDDIGRAYAAAQGLTPGEIDVEAVKFRDHWLAKAGADGRKADWPAVWRTWARGAVERRGRSFGGRISEPRAPPPDRQSSVARRMKHANDLLERLNAEYGAQPAYHD